jgi:hypothetical protein
VISLCVELSDACSLSSRSKTESVEVTEGSEATSSQLPEETLSPKASAGHCQSKFVYFAKTSEPNFAAIDFPTFFRVDLSGSMAAPSI